MSANQNQNQLESKTLLESSDQTGKATASLMLDDIYQAPAQKNSSAGEHEALNGQAAVARMLGNATKENKELFFPPLFPNEAGKEVVGGNGKIECHPQKKDRPEIKQFEAYMEQRQNSHPAHLSLQKLFKN